MAKIKLGPPVVGIRGTIGGIIFSANGSGLFARAWARGPNPQTILQNTARNSLGKFASAWRALTAGQQTGWNTYAALPAQERFDSLGESYFPSGFNQYISVNANLAIVGSAARSIAPTFTRPVAPVLFGGFFQDTGPGANSQITFDVTDPALSDFKICTAVLVNSVGILVRAHNYRFMKAAVPDVDRKIFYQLEVENIFGTIVIGQKIFLHIFTQDAQGQRGPFVLQIKIAI